MPKRPLSGDFTLTWTRKATKWEEDTDTDEEQGSELDKIFWDEEGIWHFWGGDWWILEDRWWRKWVDEQQETANKNSEEHQSINDSPEWCTWSSHISELEVHGVEGGFAHF